MSAAETLEIVEPTPAAVEAAKQSRDAIVEAAERLKPGPSGTVRLNEVDLPPSVLQALARMVDKLSEGKQITLVAVIGRHEEFTTSQAARFLGMSRPTLIALIDRGDLGVRRVGSHRRLLVKDVLAYRRRTEHAAVAAPSREEQLRGLREMADTTEEMGLGY